MQSKPSIVFGGLCGSDSLLVKNPMTWWIGWQQACPCSLLYNYRMLLHFMQNKIVFLEFRALKHCKIFGAAQASQHWTQSELEKYETTWTCFSRSKKSHGICSQTESHRNYSSSLHWVFLLRVSIGLWTHSVGCTRTGLENVHHNTLG